MANADRTVPLLPRRRLVGLSFGGGCFFENGVGTSSGSATFKLISYTIE